MKLTDLRASLGFTLALLLQACSTVPVETAQSIAAREDVLFRHGASFGWISTGSGKVVWESTGEILLTPSTLYYVSGQQGRNLSYAQITSAAVQDVALTTLLPGDKSLANQLVVRILRPNCEEGCVFNLHDEQQAAEAARVINTQRPQVDVFGRVDKSGEVWISLGARNAPFWWSTAPRYLLKTAPEEKKALDHRFCELTDCNGGGRTGSLYAAALEAELTESIATAYSFRNLHGVMVNRRTELDTRSLTTALGRVDPALDSLLVSDLRSVTLRERVSADYQISIEVTFRAFVDYFNLEPLIDGRYFWKEWSVTRPMGEWLQMSAAEFDAVIAGAARQVALQIQTDLNAGKGEVGNVSRE